MNAIPPEPGPSPALIAEVTKRTGIIWIRVPGQDRPRPAWHIWRTVTAPGPDSPGPPPPGAAYVVTGPGEQSLPGLADAVQAIVTVRSGQTGGALASWTAQVSRVEPGCAEWDAVIGALVAGRLNAPALPGEGSPAQRWARTCSVVRLAPAPTAGGR